MASGDDQQEKVEEEKAEKKSLGEEEREHMLGKESKSPGGPSPDPDPETGQKSAEHEKIQQNEHTKLLGTEEVERYRRDPFWKAVRFVLFGSLLCVFFALLVVAVLIVALSKGCTDEGGGAPEGNLSAVRSEIALGALVSEVGRKEDGKWISETKNGLSPGARPLVNPVLASVPEGESTAFQCTFPGGKLRWNRVGPQAELQSADGMESFSNGTLWIRQAKLSHQGEYVCEGYWPGDRQWHASEHAKLVVYPEEDEEESDQREQAPRERVAEKLPRGNDIAEPIVPPKVLPVRPRVDSYLKLSAAGEPVHFRCWMAGKSSDELVWRKVNMPAMDAARAGVVSLLASEPDGHSAFLIFGAVKESDAGDYECLEAKTGVSSTLVRLRVEPSRSPVVEPAEQTLPEGSPARIRCTVPGHPDAQLFWRRENGVEARAVEGVEDDGRGTLSIAATRTEHARMGWVCWAVYPRRADKQALSSGEPAVIHVESTTEVDAEEGSGEETEEENGRGTTQEGESGRDEAEEEVPDQNKEETHQSDQKAEDETNRNPDPKPEETEPNQNQKVEKSDQEPESGQNSEIKPDQNTEKKEETTQNVQADQIPEVDKESGQPYQNQEAEVGQNSETKPDQNPEAKLNENASEVEATPGTEEAQNPKVAPKRTNSTRR